MAFNGGTWKTSRWPRYVIKALFPGSDPPWTYTECCRVRVFCRGFREAAAALCCPPSFSPPPSLLLLRVCLESLPCARALPQALVPAYKNENIRIYIMDLPSAFILLHVHGHGVTLNVDFFLKTSFEPISVRFAARFRRSVISLLTSVCPSPSQFLIH